MSKEFDYHEYQESLFKAKTAIYNFIRCLDLELEGDEAKVKYEIHKLVDEVKNNLYGS